MRRLHLRTLLLATAAVVVASIAAIAVDIVVRYVPAFNALRDGEAALLDARQAFAPGAAGLDSAALHRIDIDMARARDAFGERSSIVQSGWLSGIAARLPWAGDQVSGLRALRDAGNAGASLGADVLPLLDTLHQPAAAPGALLTRMTTLATESGAALTDISSRLRDLDAAAAALSRNRNLAGPLAAARSRVVALSADVDTSLRPAMDLLGALPAALGAGTHHYLLLLDNPGEQRPGGGFIGAVGDVTFTDGALTASTFRGAEFANALVHSVAAPRALDDTLFHGHPLELSDSSWSPDFPTSAAAAAHMYELATGESVDGVFAVDPIALGYVLRVTGPIAAPPYPQKVSADGALLQLNEIINRARPGDPGKAYLAPFGAAVLGRMLSAPLSDDPAIAAALVRGAREKHIVMSFRNGGLARRADAAGLTGRLADPDSDALQIVDANVGGNKADLFVQRRFDMVASIGAGGQATDTLSLTYENVVPSDPAQRALVAQYGGAYHDYVRVYVPETASLQSMVLRDGATVTPVSPESVDFELRRESIASLLVVPPGHTVTLTLTYSGPFLDPSRQPARYTLAWAKEIGAPGWPVSLTVKGAHGSKRVTGDLTVDMGWSVTAL